MCSLQTGLLRGAGGEDAEGQRAPLWAHPQLLVSRLWGLYLCTGLRRARTFLTAAHEEHLAAVVSWICWSPAELAREGCFAAEYAAVRKSKGKFLFKAIYEKTVKRFKEQKNAGLKPFCRNHSLTTFVVLAA